MQTLKSFFLSVYKVVSNEPVEVLHTDIHHTQIHTHSFFSSALPQEMRKIRSKGAVKACLLCVCEAQYGANPLTKADWVC